MPQSCSSAARSAPKRASGTYAPPSPLEDLHILDVLELAGSQSKAGIALAMQQSTVCRHGHNACLQHLRLAYREHRLMAGVLRIGSDVLHQSLLSNLMGGAAGAAPFSQR